MVSLGITPFVWPGDSVGYTEYLCDVFADNIGGADAVRLNYTYDSGASTTKIITSFDSNGNPVVEDVAITTDNGYLLKQQYGKYYGLEVFERGELERQMRKAVSWRAVCRAMKPQSKASLLPM